MFLLIKNRNETGNENVGGGKEVEVNQRSLNQSDQLPSVFILAKSFATTFQCGVCVYCFRVCYSIYLFVCYNIGCFFGSLLFAVQHLCHFMVHRSKYGFRLHVLRCSLDVWKWSTKSSTPINRLMK